MHTYSYVSGRLSLLWVLKGQISATSNLVSKFSKAVPLHGICTATSSVVAQLLRINEIQGSLHGQSSINGQLAGGDMRGEVVSHCDIFNWLSVERPLQGTVAVQSNTSCVATSVGLNFPGFMVSSGIIVPFFVHEMWLNRKLAYTEVT